jgi:hypothetical protein
MTPGRLGRCTCLISLGRDLMIRMADEARQGAQDIGNGRSFTTNQGDGAKDQDHGGECKDADTSQREQRTASSAARTRPLAAVSPIPACLLNLPYAGCGPAQRFVLAIVHVRDLLGEDSPTTRQGRPCYCACMLGDSDSP